MAIVFFSGFESGDTSEFPNITGVPVIDTAHITQGGYSLKVVAGGGNKTANVNTLNLSTAFIRFNLYSQIAGASAQQELLCFKTAGGAFLVAVFISTDAGGNNTINVYNQVTFGPVIQSAPLSKNAWHSIEVQLTVSATIGVIGLKVDGVLIGSTGSLNTGSTNIGIITVGDGGTFDAATPSGNAWIDDVIVSNSGYVGPGYCIARQGVAGTPTFDAWTKNGAATSALCWSDTPFNATKNCSNTAISNAQTMFAGSFSAAGSAQEGVGTVNGLDVINAGKTAFIAKSTISGNLSIRRRIGGSNTDTVVAVTTSDAYYDDGIWTPTFANLTDGTTEIGAVDTVGVVTDTVEDMWLMVDFSPVGQVAPTPPPPQIQQVLANFTFYPLRLRGFWDSRVVSAAKPVGPSMARAVPIAQILRNWSQWLAPIPWWSTGIFNAAQPTGYSSPNAVPIAAILANFSMQPLRVPGFGAGFNSSFPQAFPTPPAPNLPAIIANFSPRVFPQGFISAWSTAPFLPQGYPTAPAPNIRQILLNFGPQALPLAPRVPYETATIIVPTAGPSPSALPISRIIKAWTQPLIIPPTLAAWNSSPPFVPQGFPTPPAPNVRQIILNFYPQPPNIVIPFYGSGIFVPIPQPPIGGMHARFTLILGDSAQKIYLLEAGGQTATFQLADDVEFVLKTAAAHQFTLVLAAPACNIQVLTAA